eukprot:TRINITY_DN5376_c0_g1_i1.p1 TRINITY_DN5376_c0_g1~~TRINITY_DN5376_c0_g1_i1.p1  ORF type:complete len:137 (+),score=13.88 TRINITY_DN5376_c0_g1_i1:256-666(+)
MGISRHQGLHSKAMTFHSLPDLIWDYSQNYKNDRQQLLSVRLGEAISHQGPDSYMPKVAYCRTEVVPVSGTVVGLTQKGPSSSSKTCFPFPREGPLLIYVLEGAQLYTTVKSFQTLLKCKRKKKKGKKKKKNSKVN